MFSFNEEKLVILQYLLVFDEFYGLGQGGLVHFIRGVSLAFNSFICIISIFGYSIDGNFRFILGCFARNIFFSLALFYQVLNC